MGRIPALQMEMWADAHRGFLRWASLVLGCALGLAVVGWTWVLPLVALGHAVAVYAVLLVLYAATADPWPETADGVHEDLPADEPLEPGVVVSVVDGTIIPFRPK
ncbi:hypothetical protein ACFOYU_11750 [Microvirga sp. GCM10011540]|uniref:hypothetical protein n=1 Tax=Microvirga sp. GCM10011540 TaxID=3317338 RepID=UPI00360FC780